MSNMFFGLKKILAELNHGRFNEATLEKFLVVLSYSYVLLINNIKVQYMYKNTFSISIRNYQ